MTRVDVAARANHLVACHFAPRDTVTFSRSSNEASSVWSGTAEES